MFLKTQDKAQTDSYKEMLATIGSLSRLFSEGKVPYVEYRVAENLFCKAFGADNLSRSDASADAAKDGVGIGIKTFLNGSGASMQKVAEFNSEHHLFNGAEPEEKVRKVASLRNARIETTKSIFGLERIDYHCLVRREGEILAFETPMDLVVLDKIRDVSGKKNVLTFNDGMNEYSFNSAKSTLYKRFHTKDIAFTVPVEILEDPLSALIGLLKSDVAPLTFAPINKEADHIFLPLYSTKSETRVPEKSGLNQWNAGGRDRHPNEVYIPIPAWIHKEYPDFFPGRDVEFVLTLPNKKEMSAKVCQDGSKALMSNPNSALGEWLLRGILRLKERELLTYERLETIGLDSVVLYKTAEGRYDIDFTKIGSFEDFKAGHAVNDQEESDD